MISGRAELVEIRARLGAAGITRVFVPGGDVDPVGDYPDAFSLLEDLATLAEPFEHVGITGYPETIPRSPTTSPCRRCGTNGGTPPTW